MARTKNFDREEKLIAAMELFWHKGYADTSIADLVDHLGINRFSLYNAYVDKETLYHECLDYYLTQISFPSLTELGKGDAGLEAIKAYLQRFALLQRDQQCGCFMQNAILERAHSDDEVLNTGTMLYTELDTALGQALKNAKQDGIIGNNVNTEQMSRFLVLQMQGIRVLGKARQYNFIDDAIVVLIAMLDALRITYLINVER